MLTAEYKRLAPDAKLALARANTPDGRVAVTWGHLVPVGGETLLMVGVGERARLEPLTKFDDVKVLDCPTSRQAVGLEANPTTIYGDMS